jgi:hypothetical protein
VASNISYFCKNLQRWSILYKHSIQQSVWKICIDKKLLTKDVWVHVRARQLVFVGVPIQNCRVNTQTHNHSTGIYAITPPIMGITLAESYCISEVQILLSLKVGSESYRFSLLVKCLQSWLKNSCSVILALDKGFTRNLKRQIWLWK